MRGEEVGGEGRVKGEEETQFIITSVDQALYLHYLYSQDPRKIEVFSLLSFIEVK